MVTDVVFSASSPRNSSSGIFLRTSPPAPHGVPYVIDFPGRSDPGSRATSYHDCTSLAHSHRLPEVLEALPQFVRVAAQPEAEVIVQPKKPALCDHRLELLLEGLREGGDVDRAVGEEDGPPRWDVATQGRHADQRLADDRAVPRQDALRPIEEEVPPLERPAREQMPERRIPARRVILQAPTPLQQALIRDDPPGSERPESADLRDGREGDHPRAERRGARRRLVERK